MGEKLCWFLIFMELELFFYYCSILFPPRHRVWVKKKDKWCSLTNIHREKNTKGSMIQEYIPSKRREREIVAIINIYGAISISLLFCDNQDTEYE